MTAGRKTTVVIPAELLARLDAHAARLKVRRSELIRHAAAELAAALEHAPGPFTPQAGIRGPDVETWTPERTDHYDVITGGGFTDIAEVGYFRARSGEGRHRVTVGVRTLDVRPDGVTSTAHRSKMIGHALRCLTTDPDADPYLDPLTYVAGALALRGARALELTTLPDYRCAQCATGHPDLCARAAKGARPCQTESTDQ